MQRGGGDQFATGGQAGGQKYEAHGIFFKVASDELRIYGGEEFAVILLDTTPEAVFDVLDRFEMAMAHDVRRASALVQEGLRHKTPYAVPQLNSGVLLYRRSDAMLAFLREWVARFHAEPQVDRDQVILKDLLWESDLRFWVLPPEFNLRRVTKLDAWEPLDVMPTILHSHRLLDHLRVPGADRVRTLGGVDVPLDEIERILHVLGFTVNKESEALRVSVPSWRSDIVGEACLVEEVVRIYGFDKIPAIPSLSGDSLPHPALGPNQRRRNAARRVLAGRGLVEAVTFSFLASGHAELFGEVPKSLRLINPISTDLDVMRPSLLPNLISAAGHGSDRGTRDAALFEVGPQFSGNKPEDEANAVAGIRSGSSGKRNWAEGTRPVDVFDAKADALSVLSELGAPVDKIQVVTDAPAWYHPGRSGVMRLGPKTVLAYFGEVHPRVLAKMDVKGPMAAFEVFTDNLAPIGNSDDFGTWIGCVSFCCILLPHPPTTHDRSTVFNCAHFSLSLRISS